MSIYIDLVLDTNDLVRIEAPDDIEDEVWDSIKNAMKQRDVWSPAQFEGVKADMNGLFLSRVWMSRVVGAL